MKLNLNQSVEFLNIQCGYIDVENDEDYTNKEIIKIANSKFKEMKHNKLREILISYNCEEFGDCIIDEICDLFNYPNTNGIEGGGNNGN